MENIDTIEVRILPWSVHVGYGDTAIFTVLTESDRHDEGEEKAKDRALPFCKPGLCVIVRPKYNDNDRGWFHEWRSYDGKPFQFVGFRNGE